MQTLNFTTTIHAPVSKVWDTMLNHPTYEIWTKVFSEWVSDWSSYEWSREQWSKIIFWDGNGNGMLATIAANRLHEYVSIQHLWMIEANTTNMFEWENFENYIFTKLEDNLTQLDVEMTAMPDERVPMFNEMRPKALQALKNLCE